jgi:hypothetical protein
MAKKRSKDPLKEYIIQKIASEVALRVDYQVIALLWIPENLFRFLRRLPVVVPQEPSEMFIAVHFV